MTADQAFSKNRAATVLYKFRSLKLAIEFGRTYNQIEREQFLAYMLLVESHTGLLQ
jgi:hypothetical protein